MKKLITIFLSVVICLSITIGVWAASATKDKCVAKCHEAAKMLQKDRDRAIVEIGKKDGKFVWKDTYVFLMDFK